MGRVASHGLVHSAAHVGAPPSLTNPSSFIEGIRAHRLAGVAIEWLEVNEAAVSKDVGDQIVRIHEESMASSMRVEIELLSVSALLAGLEIDHRLLKGAALAHQFATSPETRPFRDVDILVKSVDVDRTVEVLQASGASRRFEQLRPGFDQRFGKSVTMRRHGVEIDVHRLLAWGPFGVRMEPNDLFVVPSTVQVAGQAIPTLDATDHLLHACLHVALGQHDAPLINVRDIALLACTSIDWSRFVDTAQRWNCGAAIRRAAAIVEAQLCVDLACRWPLDDIVGSGDPASDAEILRPYIWSGDRYRPMAKAMLSELNPVDRVSFALAVGLPAGASLTKRASKFWKRSP